MNIENRVGDIFTQNDVDIIVHQANCYHTMGAGIAKIIRENYPEAYKADCETVKGTEKLGTYSTAYIKDNNRQFVIANLYGQGGFDKRKRGLRDTNYDALNDAFTSLRDDLLKANSNRVVTIGVPYGIGCGLGGGSWRIVTAIIESIFLGNPNFKIVICRIPSQPELE